MPATIHITNMYAKCPTGDRMITVDTTSKAGWSSDLSPFKLGPCKLYDERTSKNMENAWQYAKVYSAYAENGLPTDTYWKWAEEGWNNPKAIRYPMGRGTKPLYSLWGQNKLGYIAARKTIYGPLYIETVTITEGFKKLQTLYQENNHLTLRDYDGYNHTAHNMTLTDVLNNPRKKMGHAFILAMLLTNDPALKLICPIKDHHQCQP